MRVGIAFYDLLLLALHHCRWAKGAVGIHGKLQAVMGMGKGPELRAATRAVHANADVHGFAGLQSVGV